MDFRFFKTFFLLAWIVRWGAAFSLTQALAQELATRPAPCAIEIVEKGSGWPVSLVELTATHRLSFVSDNAGRIAIDAPELMNRDVWFEIHGNGYEVAKDGFGYRGRKLRITPGGHHRIELDRTILARRIGRLTGAGLFAESQKLGLELGWNETGVFGCDSVQNAIHRGKLFWFWGDTSLADYPLGIFQATGATSPPTPLFQIRPPLKLSLSWFSTSNGAPRGVANLPGSGPTWLSGLVSLPDAKGTPHLGALYAKIKPPLEAYEYGLAVWDEASERFERLAVLWTRTATDTKPPPLPDGHAARWEDAQARSWALFGNPFPMLRCPATFEAWQNPKTWESISPPAALSGVLDGKQVEVKPHSGAIAFHPALKRWVAVFMQSFGKPSVFGELWYVESDSPLGPWGAAVKILSHENYTFYNPSLHLEFSNPAEPTLFFEGTYTREFSRNQSFTPRYDYNQILYELDLHDPGLAPAR